MQPIKTASELIIRLPDKIQAALDVYASENQFPIELVVEMAIASFLDVDAVTYNDCNPVTTPGQLREENLILKQQMTQGRAL
jgi:hypothetical protein